MAIAPNSDLIFMCSPPFGGLPPVHPRLLKDPCGVAVSSLGVEA
jgi:hypothetical protein